jgi:hypothetical protein
MEVHKLFWLLGEQANINYDKMPSRGIFHDNISRLYLNEVTKKCHGRRYFGWGSKSVAPAQSKSDKLRLDTEDVKKRYGS